MKILYNADVLSEKTILLWYTKGKNPKVFKAIPHFAPMPFSAQ